MGYTIIRNGQTMNPDGLTVESLFARSALYAWIQPDGWQGGGYSIFEGDDFDKKYFGPDTLRIETGHKITPTLAIRVKITGRKAMYDIKDNPGYRCQIEFIGDCEPSTFTNGIVYLKKYS